MYVFWKQSEFGMSFDGQAVVRFVAVVRCRRSDTVIYGLPAVNANRPARFVPLVTLLS